MKIYEFGNAQAETVLIEPVGDHEFSSAERIISGIQKSAGEDIRMIFLKVDDWNLQLSPWESPAVFGNEDFKGGAAETLKAVTELCAKGGKRFYIGGYSLAGLFALWAAYQCDAFEGVAAASPSVWFPGFTAFMESRKIQSKAVYLSLGDREEKTAHPVLGTVGESIRTAHELLKRQNVRTVLEWNKGGHFKDPEKRVAAAFAKAIELSRT